MCNETFWDSVTPQDNSGFNFILYQAPMPTHSQTNCNLAAWKNYNR